MRVTLTIEAGPVTWGVCGDYDPGDPDRHEDPELDLLRGQCSDGRELTGLALEAELERAGVDHRLMGLARAAASRARTARWSHT